MNSWLLFFRNNKKLITFGFLLTFFSSFGQTFLVSLFVPEVLKDFELTNASFGSVYAAATLASAFCLTWAGRYIDQLDLRKFSWLVISGLALALLVFSQATHIAVLAIALWGMRLFGQGLTSHTAITTMARYFEHARGKAISITTLGFPAGSAIFPLFIALGIEAMGWRYTLVVSAILVVAVLSPLIPYLLREVETDPEAFRKIQEEQQLATDSDTLKQQKPSYKEIFTSRTFWLIAPGSMAIPFMNTAFFFYQIPLAEAKGWTAEWVAASFVGYSIASALCMLAAGSLIDRLSAVRLFPYFLFPLLGALVLVITFDSAWITPVYLILIGISSGFGNTIKSAVQAELFGVEFLGTIRSLFTALMVVSTALGPAIFGFLLDGGLSFEQTFSVAAVYLLLTIGWNFRIMGRASG